MKLSELKAILPTLASVRFKLSNGTEVPPHFHLTEVGLVTKHFVDCGGVQRKERTISLQLWVASDFDHRLSATKFHDILHGASKLFENSDALTVEIEYQQDTIGKFELAFDGESFLLVPTRTACLAEDACGVSGLTVLGKKLTSSCNEEGCC